MAPLTESVFFLNHKFNMTNSEYIVVFQKCTKPFGLQTAIKKN